MQIQLPTHLAILSPPVINNDTWVVHVEQISPILVEKQDRIKLMGLVRIMSWYPNFKGSHFWLATQRDPQNDWTATQNGVNYDVFVQAPFAGGIALL